MLPARASPPFSLGAIYGYGDNVDVYGVPFQLPPFAAALKEDVLQRWPGALVEFYGMTEGTEKALVADVVPKARRGAAFGWYNLAIGLGALPASLIFGWIWDRSGSPSAFAFGATLALVAAILMAVVAPSSQSRETK